MEIYLLKMQLKWIKIIITDKLKILERWYFIFNFKDRKLLALLVQKFFIENQIT